jgi:APA family basic amino acid/polyamine antiporter
LIYVGYAYSGWNGAAYLAGEIEEPARILPRSLIGGTLSVLVLYLVVNLTYVYALDPEAMTTRSPAEVERVAELAVVHLFGRSTADVFAVLVGLSLIASVSAYLLAGPRVTFAMARDGCFPTFAGHLHPSRAIPVGATLAQGGAAIAFVWSGSFLQLLDYTSVGLAAVSGLMVASVIPIHRRPDLNRPYRLPLYPGPPLFYLGLVGWTVAFQLLQPDRRVPALLSLATLLAGVPLAQVFVPRSRSL